MRWLTTIAIENGRVLFPAIVLALLGSAVLIFRRARPGWVRSCAVALCVALALPALGGFLFTSTILSVLARRTDDFSFRLVADDAPRSLADYAGSVVVLNFWATWCDPCLAELPDLERLARAHAGKVSVLTVSDERVEHLRSKAPKSSALVNGYFASGTPSATIDKIAYQGRPTTIILDRAGQVRQILIGGHTYDDFEAAVRRLL